MKEYHQHFISHNETIKSALQKLNLLQDNLTLFVIEGNNKLVGTLTDGDIRRALIGDYTVYDTIDKIMNINFIKLVQGNFNFSQILIGSSLIKLFIALLPIILFHCIGLIPLKGLLTVKFSSVNTSSL